MLFENQEPEVPIEEYSGTRLNTKLCKFVMTTTGWLIGWNLVAFIVSLPAALVIAQHMFPLDVFVTIGMIPVLALGLGGVIVSFFAGFVCKQCKRAMVLMVLSVIQITLCCSGFF